MATALYSSFDLMTQPYKKLTTIKPRIWFIGNSKWTCCDDFFRGIGNTPLEAYRAWIQDKKGLK